MLASVLRVYALLHEPITTFPPPTARAKGKQDARHYRLSDAGALGVFLHTTTFL